jgi:hypothetical protein
MDAISISYIRPLLGPGGRGLLVPSYSRDDNWIKDHLRLPMVHMVMDADLSRFKTIVTEHPGQTCVSSGARWKDFCHYFGFSWAADWQSHFVVHGTDSNSNKITWINFHPNPSSCPLNVLKYAATFALYALAPHSWLHRVFHRQIE